MIELRILRLLSLCGALTAAGCLGSEPQPFQNAGEDAGTTTATGTGSDTSDTDGDTTDGTGTGSGGDGVTCDQAVCVNPDLCCASMAASGCKSACEGGEVLLECDGPEDCGSGVCCWGLTAGSVCRADATECTAATPSVACHSSRDCGGAACEPHIFVSWISICAAP